MVDLVANVKRKTDVREVNLELQKAAQGRMKRYVQYTEEPLVSADFNGNEHSSVVDGLSTMVMEERQIKVLAWYDNEWGYSCRVVDLVKYIASFMDDRMPTHHTEAGIVYG